MTTFIRKLSFTGRTLAATLALVLCSTMALFFAVGAPSAADGETPTRFAGPTSSQPLALTADDAFLVVANADNNSVTFFNVRRDHFRRLAEIKVQKEPNGVAFLPDGRKAYTANTISGTVSVINTDIDDGKIKSSRIKIKKHI